jgi:hypothetical protein
VKIRFDRRLMAALVLPLALTFVVAAPVWAHCDGLDGPVVAAGRVALESGDVRHALVWVLPKGEPEVRGAFEHAVAVRTLGDEARELADRYFFETLVRVHREGEGEAYTGLKSAGRDIGPVIPAADAALEHGSAAELEALLVDHLRHGLRERFHAAKAARHFAPTDLAAGRAYVQAYVSLLHYLEALHELLAGHDPGHAAPEKPVSSAGHPGH